MFEFSQKYSEYESTNRFPASYMKMEFQFIDKYRIPHVIMITMYEPTNLQIRDAIRIKTRT
jgi:hypothetical protein